MSWRTLCILHLSDKVKKHTSHLQIEKKLQIALTIGISRQQRSFDTKSTVQENLLNIRHSTQILFLWFFFSFEIYMILLAKINYEWQKVVFSMVFYWFSTTCIWFSFKNVLSAQYYIVHYYEGNIYTNIYIQAYHVFSAQLRYF